MRHRELTLRFFALLHRRDRYRTPFRHFLNMEMEEHRQASSDDLHRFERQFNLATLWSSRVFGDEVFKLFELGQESSPSGRWRRQRSDLVYEVEMVGFAHAGERLEPYWNKCQPDQGQLLAEGLRYRLIDAMSRDDFRRTLLERTRDASLVQDRFRLWIQAVDAAANSPDELIAEAGSLSDALNRSSLCDVCDTPVFRDDAARGSEPGTRARIHRYCKLSRT